MSELYQELSSYLNANDEYHAKQIINMMIKRKIPITPPNVLGDVQVNGRTSYLYAPIEHNNISLATLLIDNGVILQRGDLENIQSPEMLRLVLTTNPGIINSTMNRRGVIITVFLDEILMNPNIDLLKVYLENNANININVQGTNTINNKIFIDDDTLLMCLLRNYRRKHLDILHYILDHPELEISGIPNSLGETAVSLAQDLKYPNDIIEKIMLKEEKYATLTLNVLSEIVSRPLDIGSINIITKMVSGRY